jgi:hypothetical protein
MTGGLPFRATTRGLRLSVRLTPRARQNGLDGLVHGSDGRPALKVKVAAPPVEGTANAALIAYIASALKLRKADVRIISGETARMKLLELSGDADLIAARLMEWISASSTKMQA